MGAIGRCVILQTHVLQAIFTRQNSGIISMSLIKPYRSIPIHECGEPLVPIPREAFAFFDPHPYIAMGAPYGVSSPWMLRLSVLGALQKAQQRLHGLKP